MLRAGVFQAEYIAQHCYQVPHLGKYFFFFSPNSPGTRWNGQGEESCSRTSDECY